MRTIFLLYGLVFLGFCQTTTTSNPENIRQDRSLVADSLSPKNITATEPEIKLDTSITIDYLTGKFEPATHPDFVKIPSRFANGRSDRFLHRDTWAAFQKMYEAARADSINLVILSATRNFAIQKIIWEGKWTGKRLHENKENLALTTPDPVARAQKILRWSSMPGTSRHHWGTDLDLNHLTNDYFEQGKGRKVYEWLTQNAARFGFCQPYSPKGAERPFGYNEEKWHWSYLPLATQLTDQARLRLTDEQITGFKGSATAQQIGVVEKYILGINPQCL